MSATATLTRSRISGSELWHLCRRSTPTSARLPKWQTCVKCGRPATTLTGGFIMSGHPPCHRCSLPKRHVTACLHHSASQSWSKKESDDATVDVRGEPPWRVMFFGSDQFSMASLKALHKCRTQGELVDALHVVCPETKYIKRRGRTRVVSPVWQYCHDNDLPTVQWPIRGEVRGYDVGVLSSFGHLVPSYLIGSFPYGIVNIHPSLLPRWRGASPITSAILEGDTTTGVSIMRIMADRFDVGPILLQESQEIPDGSTTESLQEILADMGAAMILRVLSALPRFIAEEKMQPHDGVTVCGKITASMAVIDWGQTCAKIDRLYRAIGQQFPLETCWHGSQIRLHKMADPKETAAININIADAALGEVYYDKISKQICIKCRDNWVSFGEVTLKKRMTAQDFYNGYLSAGRGSGKQYFT